jgi:hypothetical protein
MSQGLQGIEQIRTGLGNFPRTAVLEEYWCQRADAHHFDQAMDSPIERARLATRLHRQLQAGEMTHAEHTHQMVPDPPSTGRMLGFLKKAREVLHPGRRTRARGSQG